MSYLKNSQLSASRLNRSLAYGRYIPTPSFTETVGLAFEETTENELLTSPVRMRAEYWNPQQADLTKMRDSGEITPEEWLSFRRRGRRGGEMDWEGLGDYVNEKMGTDRFDFTNKTLHDKQAVESQERQQKLEKAAGVSGAAGQFVGTAGAMLNPATAAVEAASMLIPGTQLRFGASAMSTMAKMAFREGALNVGFEAIYQGNVYDFKKRVGMEYSLGEGAVNILAAFTFGSVIGAGRGLYNVHVGNSSVTDAIAANKVMIDELEARTDLDAAERVILQDLQQTQEFFQRTGPNDKPLIKPTSGARQAYERSLKEIQIKHAAQGQVAQTIGRQLATLNEETPTVGGYIPPPPIDDVILRRRGYESVTEAIKRYGVMERTTDSAFSAEQLLDFRARLIAEADQRIPRGERKQLQAEIEDLQFRLNRVTDDALPVVPRRGVSARKAKQEARKAGGQAGAQERALLRERIDAIETRLDASARGSAAEADLTRLEQGIVPERFADEALQTVGVRSADFAELAAQDDMALMQDYFTAVAGRDTGELAGRVYNELARRERIDTIANQDMVPHVPDEAVPQVSADIRDSASVSPKFEMPEDYVPEGDLERPMMEFTDDGQITARPLREVIEESDKRLAESHSKIDNTVACIRG